MKHIYTTKLLEFEHSPLRYRNNSVIIPKSVRKKSFKRITAKPLAVPAFLSATLIAAAILGTTLMLSGCDSAEVAQNAINANRYTQFTMIMIPAPTAQKDEDGGVKLPVKRDLEFSNAPEGTPLDVELGINSPQKNFSRSVNSNQNARNIDYSPYLLGTNQNIYSESPEFYDYAQVAAAILKVNFVAEASSVFSGSKYKVSVITGANSCVYEFLSDHDNGNFCNEGFHRDGFSFSLSESDMTRITQTFVNPSQVEPFEINTTNAGEQSFKIKVHKRLTLAPVIYNSHQMFVVKNAPAIEFLVEHNGRWESRAYGLIKRHCHTPVYNENSGCDDLANGADQAGHLVFAHYLDSDGQYYTSPWAFFNPIRHLPPQHEIRQAFGRYTTQALTREAQTTVSSLSEKSSDRVSLYDSDRTTYDHEEMTYFATDFEAYFIGADLEKIVQIQVPYSSEDRHCLNLPGVPKVCPQTVLDLLGQMQMFESRERHLFYSKLESHRYACALEHEATSAVPPSQVTPPAANTGLDRPPTREDRDMWDQVTNRDEERELRNGYSRRFRERSYDEGRE